MIAIRFLTPLLAFLVVFTQCVIAEDGSDQSRIPTVNQMLALKPVMEGVTVAIPKDDAISSCIAKRIDRKDLKGYQLQTADRKTIRRFLDTNADGKVDRWVYFHNGSEVYRDVDIDHDGVVDSAVQTFKLSRNDAGKYEMQMSGPSLSSE